MANREELRVLLLAQGFEVWPTGGGCTAWGKFLDSRLNGHILVTNLDGLHEADGDDWLVGVYDEEHDAGRALYLPTTHGPKKCWWLEVSETRDTLEEALRAASEFAEKADKADKAKQDTPLVDDALNAACKSVQDALGVTSGDVAGVFFTGENLEKFQALFREYVAQERAHILPRGWCTGCGSVVVGDFDGHIQACPGEAAEIVPGVCEDEHG